MKMPTGLHRRYRHFGDDDARHDNAILKTAGLGCRRNAMTTYDKRPHHQTRARRKNMPRAASRKTCHQQMRDVPPSLLSMISRNGRIAATNTTIARYGALKVLHKHFRKMPHARPPMTALILTAHEKDESCRRCAVHFSGSRVAMMRQYRH